jgi:hypothetical protein
VKFKLDENLGRTAAAVLLEGEIRPPRTEHIALRLDLIAGITRHSGDPRQVTATAERLPAGQAFNQRRRLRGGCVGCYFLPRFADLLFLFINGLCVPSPSGSLGVRGSSPLSSTKSSRGLRHTP